MLGVYPLLADGTCWFLVFDFDNHEKGKRVNSYGMVIMDECHHAGSATAVQVLQKVNARYVYGVTATPKRGDNLEKIIHMLLGPIRHSYTAKKRAMEQGIGHYVYPGYTRVIDTLSEQGDTCPKYRLLAAEANGGIVYENHFCRRRME